jgi:ferric-dicitrate binding protein FerR (iron transport regulator)
MANSDDDFIEATLLEGAIEILDLKNENSQKNNLVLEPGQKLTLYIDKEGSNIQTINTDGMLIPEKGNAIARIKNTNLTDSFNLEQSTAWTNNKLVFTRERFKDVKTKLERWYGVNIEVKNEEILNYHFTGTFENETFEQAMSALSAAAGCSFKTNKNQVIVSK